MEKANRLWSVRRAIGFGRFFRKMPKDAPGPTTARCLPHARHSARLGCDSPMSMKTSGSIPLVMTLVLVLLTSCATGIQMSRTTPAQLSASAADGRSSSLHSGNHFAYWLWKEDDGTWHLRTTSARQEHRFQGRIHPMTAGSIEALVGVGLEGGGRRHRGDGMDLSDGDIV